MTMAAAAAVLISQCPGIAVEAAPPEKGNWTLLPAASDEFDGTCLNEEKWTNGIWYDVTTDLAFHPENVSVRDGNLVLAAKKRCTTEKTIQLERWSQNLKCRERQAMWKCVRRHSIKRQMY